MHFKACAFAASCLASLRQSGLVPSLDLLTSLFFFCRRRDRSSQVHIASEDSKAHSFRHPRQSSPPPFGPRVHSPRPPPFDQRPALVLDKGHRRGPAKQSARPVAVHRPVRYVVVVVVVVQSIPHPFAPLVMSLTTFEVRARASRSIPCSPSAWRIPCRGRQAPVLCYFCAVASMAAVPAI